MAQTQSEVSGTVLTFRQRIAPRASLTIRDRMDVAEWRENARSYGYDRLVIHERLASDPPEVGSFLSVYRHGEPWSRWGMTRMGDSVIAWCSKTGANVGRFATMSEALFALLPCGNARQPASAPVPFPSRALSHPPLAYGTTEDSRTA